MLKMSSFNNLMVLPFDEGRCASVSSCSASFSAGDIRANLVIIIKLISRFLLILSFWASLRCIYCLRENTTVL